MSKEAQRSSPFRAALHAFGGRYWRPGTAGFLLGAALGFALPTLVRTATGLGTRPLGVVSGYLSRFLVWPLHGGATLLVILFASALFYSPRLVGFLERLWRSWRAGLVTWIGVVWFVSSAVAFGLFNIAGSRAYLFLLLAGGLGSGAVLGRDWLLCRQAVSTVSDETDPDEPICEMGEDFIGRGAVVASVVRAVTSGQTPVVALTGGYGDGKTSVLNLARGELRKRPDVVVVPFSTWLPMGEEALVSGLLGSVLDELQVRLFVPRIRRSLVGFARALFVALPRIPASVRDLLGQPSQSDRVRELRQSLRTLPFRVAVLLDDMDRMHGNELGALLRLVRGIPEFPQFTYVCAFDRSALVETLRQSYPFGSEDAGHRFLEKFFPEEIPLPKIEESLIADEFEKRLYSICDRSGLLADPQERLNFQNDFRALWLRYAKGYVTNLRRLKLLANRLGRLLPAVGPEVNLRDFMLLELVRMMDPVAYEEIFRNARYFAYYSWVPLARWHTLATGVLDDEEERKRRHDYFDVFFKDRAARGQGPLLGILGEVFPMVRSYLLNREDSQTKPLASSAEEERRACHPDFFPRYFILRAPSDLFGETELTAFISEMNKRDDVDACVRILKSAFAALPKATMKRLDFLYRVDSSIGKFRDPALRSVPVAISELSDGFDEGVPGGFESAAALKVVFDSAKRRGEAAERQDVIGRVIRGAQSDRFAAEILNGCRPKAPSLKAPHAFDMVKMESAFRERMGARYGKSSGLTFFPAKSNADLMPLGRWGSCGQEGREQVERYLRREFEIRHSNIGNFLLRFFPGGEVVDDPRESDPVATIRRMYFPAEELLALLDAYGDSAFSSDDEARAIGEFKTSMRGRASRDEPDLPENEV